MDEQELLNLFRTLSQRGKDNPLTGVANPGVQLKVPNQFEMKVPEADPDVDPGFHFKVPETDKDPGYEIKVLPRNTVRPTMTAADFIAMGQPTVAQGGPSVTQSTPTIPATGKELEHGMAPQRPQISLEQFLAMAKPQEDPGYPIYEDYGGTGGDLYREMPLGPGPLTQDGQGIPVQAAPSMYQEPPMEVPLAPGSVDTDTSNLAGLMPGMDGMPADALMADVGWQKPFKHKTAAGKEVTVQMTKDAQGTPMVELDYGGAFVPLQPGSALYQEVMANPDVQKTVAGQAGYSYKNADDDVIDLDTEGNLVLSNPTLGVGPRSLGGAIQKFPKLYEERPDLIDEALRRRTAVRLKEWQGIQAVEQNRERMNWSTPEEWIQGDRGAWDAEYPKQLAAAQALYAPVQPEQIRLDGYAPVPSVGEMKTSEIAAMLPWLRDENYEVDTEKPTKKKKVGKIKREIEPGKKLQLSEAVEMYRSMAAQFPDLSPKDVVDKIQETIQNDPAYKQEYEARKDRSTEQWDPAELDNLKNLEKGVASGLLLGAPTEDENGNIVTPQVSIMGERVLKTPKGEPPSPQEVEQVAMNNTANALKDAAKQARSTSSSALTSTPSPTPALIDLDPRGEDFVNRVVIGAMAPFIDKLEMDPNTYTDPRYKAYGESFRKRAPKDINPDVGTLDITERLRALKSALATGDKQAAKAALIPLVKFANVMTANGVDLGMGDLAVRLGVSRGQSFDPEKTASEMLKDADAYNISTTGGETPLRQGTLNPQAYDMMVLPRAPQATSTSSKQPKPYSPPGKPPIPVEMHMSGFMGQEPMAFGAAANGGLAGQILASKLTTQEALASIDSGIARLFKGGGANAPGNVKDTWVPMKGKPAMAGTKNVFDAMKQGYKQTIADGSKPGASGAEAQLYKEHVAWLNSLIPAFKDKFNTTKNPEYKSASVSLEKALAEAKAANGDPNKIWFPGGVGPTVFAELTSRYVGGVFEKYILQHFNPENQKSLKSIVGPVSHGDRGVGSPDPNSAWVNPDIVGPQWFGLGAYTQMMGGK